MNSELKMLVDFSLLKDEKRRLEYYRNKIFENGRSMAKLTFDRSVGLYALNFDRYLDLLHNGNTDDEKARVFLDIMRTLEHLDGVKEYIRLRGDNAHLKYLIEEYFRQVNMNFRYDLCKMELPSIYVKSSDGFTHIIDDEKNLENRNGNETIVYPLYNLESKRDLRHFYNKLSFHYLESLIDDCDFDISNKKLGKILIK